MKEKLKGTIPNKPLPLDVRLGLTKAEDVKNPLRWGILGAGEISRQWVHAVRACEGASVSAVAARDINRARQFAEKNHIKNFAVEQKEFSNKELYEEDLISKIVQQDPNLICLAGFMQILSKKFINKFIRFIVFQVYDDYFFHVICKIRI